MVSGVCWRSFPSIQVSFRAIQVWFPIICGDSRILLTFLVERSDDDSVHGCINLVEKACSDGAGSDEHEFAIGAAERVEGNQPLTPFHLDFQQRPLR